MYDGGMIDDGDVRRCVLTDDDGAYHGLGCMMIMYDDVRGCLMVVDDDVWWSMMMGGDVVWRQMMMVDGASIWWMIM